MPLPPAGKRGKEISERLSEHLYVTKINIRIRKLRHLLNSIYDIASSNLVLSDANTGVNYYSMNYLFADTLDKLSKTFVTFSDKLCSKASEIREWAMKAEDSKANKQPVQFITEITDDTQKSDAAKDKASYWIAPFRKSSTCRPKREVISMDEEENGEAGDPDGHFLYSKTNENDIKTHTFKCDFCNKVFRDRNDLRNHTAQHNMEYYTCLQCNKIFRTLRSFTEHETSHNARHTCNVCAQTFLLKTTLKNYMSVHCEPKLVCSHPGCEKKFCHRSNHLEHITWSHHKTKDVPCNHCKKYFQTPTSMRAHRVVYHGYVEEITPGHPHSKKDDLFTSTRNKQSAGDQLSPEPMARKSKGTGGQKKLRNLTPSTEVLLLSGDLNVQVYIEY